MKKTLILLLSFYQKFISPAINSLLGINSKCRFETSCSEYAKTKIEEEGVFRGGYYSLLRVLKCQPFYTN